MRYNKMTVSPLESKIDCTIFKSSVRTSKRTPHFTITKINWLTLFKEIIAVYTEKSYKTHKYKMQSYLLLVQVVRMITNRF
jgi:hypothetical protein